MKTTIAYSINNQKDRWVVRCPDCEFEEEWEGFFYSKDVYNCDICSCQYRATKLVGDDWEIL